MSLTIFEGPDGAGKTTLAEALGRMIPRLDQGRQPRDSCHGPYLEEGGDYLARTYMSDILQAFDARWSMIMDRSWISESVYGPLMRNKNRILVSHRRALERMTLAAGGVVILCLPSFESCLKSYRSRLEYVPSEALMKIVYDDYAAMKNEEHAIPTFVFNYDVEPSKTLFLDLVHDERSNFVNLGPGSGHFVRGNTLIVGEQLSEWSMAAPYPFVSWDPRGCTAWLSQLLEEWNVPERELYWINALDRRGRETDPDPWLAELNPDRVIALGEVAYAWANKHRILGADIIAVPHPQFWKRFHSHETYPLKGCFVNA